MHHQIAERCIAHKKHMVTASYTSPAMAALDEKAKSANVTILNELGLDPGIDHLTAMKVFDEVHHRKGRMTSFVSWCGGLPAPEASDNPLGYKFSWSPRGVLLAGLNEAKYRMDGKLIEVPGSRLLKSAVDVPIYRGFALEGIPNRDSLKYIDLYGLKGDRLETMFRGTLRYKGYSELMGAFGDLGLISLQERSELKNGGNVPWLHLLFGSKPPMSKDTIRAALKQKLSGASAALVERVAGALEWLGMLDPSKLASVPEGAPPTVLDAFCALLQKMLVYGPDERDMVCMHHVFGIEWADGSKEHRTSTLVVYGDPKGYSAMAKTVGLPAAMGTEMLLDNALSRRGVVAPMTKDIYEPILGKLEQEGIRCTEHVREL
ncbi:hypothetical protein HK102_000141 [Quaeritorhiza haematococci]|nr:hypothetical protein HK102_000141 [Quaeritorhiza haematococci]